MNLCKHCGESEYRSLGTIRYCWGHYWQEMIPRRRNVSLRLLGLRNEYSKIGHFEFVEWVDRETKEARVKCSLCGSETQLDPFHALGFPCSYCADRAGVARRMILLPPPLIGDIPETLNKWSRALREAVETGDITGEEASTAWAGFEYTDE